MLHVFVAVEVKRATITGGAKVAICLAKKRGLGGEKHRNLAISPWFFGPLYLSRLHPGWGGVDPNESNWVGGGG